MNDGPSLWGEVTGESQTTAHADTLPALDRGGAVSQQFGFWLSHADLDVLKELKAESDRLHAVAMAKDDELDRRWGKKRPGRRALNPTLYDSYVALKDGTKRVVDIRPNGNLLALTAERKALRVRLAVEIRPNLILESKHDRTTAAGERNFQEE